LNTIWEKRGWVACVLYPVSLLFKGIVFLRSAMFNAGMLKVQSFAVPVIVVGNISVGGTGKTPIVSALVNRCKSAGLQPGIVSRGYGAAPAKLPRLIDSTTPVELSGDEPLLLARETGVPVCICANRSAAVKWLEHNSQVDVVISDDGMQHYAMDRHIELAVVDGQRLLGNRWLLPAGPLRESPKRLRQVNMVAVQQAKNATEAQITMALTAVNTITHNSSVTSSTAITQPTVLSSPTVGSFYLHIEKVRCLADQQLHSLAVFQAKQVHAVAGVGNPDRFFTSLRAAGIDVIEHAMSDHHHYTDNDIAFDDSLPILITSKDAVKIGALSADLTRVYEVSVAVSFDTALDQAINTMIASLVTD